MSQNGIILDKDLPAEIVAAAQTDGNGEAGTTGASGKHSGKLYEIEKKEIEAVLKKTGFKTSEAAKILGISRSSIYRRMKEYDIKKSYLEE